MNGPLAQSYFSLFLRSKKSFCQIFSNIVGSIVCRQPELEFELELESSMVRVVGFLSDAGKINRFSHSNEHPKRILCYLITLFDVMSSKIGHHFTK